MKIKHTWWFFIPALIVAVLGSYLSYGQQSALSYISIIVCLVFMAAAFVISKSDKSSVPNNKFEINIIGGLSLILLGTLMFIDFFKTIKTVNDEKLGYFYIINAVFLLLTAIIFVVLGLESIVPQLGKGLKKYPMIMLIPSAYMITNLIIKFLNYTTSAVAGTEMLDLVYLSLLMLFLFYYIVLYVGFDSPGTVNYMFIFGLGAVVLCAAYNFSYFYGLHKTGQSMGLNENIRTYEDLLLCVYIVAYLFEMTRHMYVDELPVEEPDEISEEDKRYEKIIEEYEVSENIREGIDSAEQETDSYESEEEEIDEKATNEKINKLIDEIFSENNK